MERIYVHSGMNKFYQVTEKYQKYIAGVLGVVYIMLGIIRLTGDSKNLFFIFYLFIGVVFIFSSMAHKKFKPKVYLLIDDSKIEFRNSSLRTHIIGWEDIQSIHIQPVSFEIRTRQSEKILVPLDWYDQKFVQQVKQKLPEIAREKSVEIV